MKRALLLAGLVVNLVHSSLASAQEAPTQWAPIEKSLTTLLNEGWRVISYDHFQTVYEHFSFVLAKESKVVICLIDKPLPNNATSRCRALN